MKHRRLEIAGVLASTLLALGFHPQQAGLGAPSSCDPIWIPTFGGLPGVDDEILALAVWDDGSGDGPALYAGGRFEWAGGVETPYLARWTGTRWTAIDGSPDFVRALAVYDDGSGPALYVGGDFTQVGGVAAAHVARWDGTTWSALGSGVDEDVLSLFVFDDGGGSGPALYAGGWFQTAGGQPAAGVAKWDGAGWSALGSGIAGGSSPGCWALGSFDDGGGAALYAGGRFSEADGAPADNVAKWDGTSWSALGSGTNGIVRSLASFDDGSGPALYAGGSFTGAGGSTAYRAARWDGSSWSPLGSGFFFNGGEGAVHCLAPIDLGSGTSLYAGGRFNSAGGVHANFVARWNGAGWESVGGGVVGNVNALVAFDDPAPGTALYAAGTIGHAGGATADRIARWDGSSWFPLPSGLNGTVEALVSFDDGDGPSLYAGGEFTSASGKLLNHVARWDGAEWWPVGDGLDGGAVYALEVHDDGTGQGPALYAAGSFTSPGPRVARWNGAVWESVGGGIGNAGNDFVRALEVFDEGDGPVLFAGGRFHWASGAPVRNLVRWDGSHWSEVGSGPNAGPNNTVFALQVYEENGRERLFVGGMFPGANGEVVNNVARWTGLTWSAVGGGLAYDDVVQCFAVHDDGSGRSLYVGGFIDSAGGAAVDGIVRWDGSAWYPLAGGIVALAPFAMHSYDDGCGAGAALYVGGSFSQAGGVPARNIASWDGSTWSPLGGGTNESRVNALAVFDDRGGGGPALYAGGGFRSAVDSGDSYVAKWGHPEFPVGVAYCFGDGTGAPCPCDNEGGAGRGCANSSGVGAALEGDGSASVGADDLMLAGTGLLPGQPALLFAAAAPVNGGDGAGFGDGLRCAGGGALRLGVRQPDGAGSATWGPGLAARAGFLPGDTRRFQLWYRDPISGPCGSGFNLSNGFAVLFIL